MEGLVSFFVRLMTSAQENEEEEVEEEEDKGMARRRGGGASDNNEDDGFGRWTALDIGHEAKKLLDHVGVSKLCTFVALWFRVLAK
jgi:hypothetical protein